MKRKLIVMLVSDQTIPNVQFLKWYFSNNLQPVDVLFISTDKMEAKDKSSDIQSAVEYLAKYSSKPRVLCVDENSLTDIRGKVENCLKGWVHDSFIVNITGGTKLMSLATYEYFRTLSEAEVYYQPINHNLQRLLPSYAEFPVSQLLSLAEYMKAHGISFRYDNSCVKPYGFNKGVYDSVIKESRDEIRLIVAMQNNSYFKNIFKRKDFVSLPQIPDEKFVTPEGSQLEKDAVCTAIARFDFDIEHLTRSELRYITGGWFEEYVYQKTKDDLHLNEANIALNVHMEKGSDKNELDVIYLDSQNALHVIECKSFVDGKEGNAVLNDALYKLQAIMKSKFGLAAKSHLYTKSLVSKDTVLNRAKEFGIAISDGAVL